MAFDAVRRFLFFAKGWWNAGIPIFSSCVALITDIVALYFCAVPIISFSDLGSFSDRVLIGQVW